MSYFRFDALVRDVFPGIEFKDIEYETLAEAIREVCKETSLVVNEMQVNNDFKDKLLLNKGIHSYSVV